MHFILEIFGFQTDEDSFLCFIFLGVLNGFMLKVYDGLLFVCCEV